MRNPIPFGKYLLLDRINVGGMAEVFLAKSFGVEGFERLLAIKKILPTMVEDQEFITMFIDEARIAVQLNHANIVQIYELGKHDENYFIAMEYVSGRDLRTILDRYKRRGELMPLPQSVYIAQKMCEGLDYAHRKKDAKGNEMHIVHRDVSPQNILLSFDGEVKLIDFGIAKAANRSQKTQAGILKGKFGYMSPEQVRGLPIDGRSDIFAVGVCLYEMVTGEKLFVGESDFSTLEKVRNAEVPKPTTFKPDLPEGLEQVLMKALARDVEERYQHASDMQEDLLRFLLMDGTIFGAKHLSGFMHQEFQEDIAREAERMEAFAEVSAPPEVERAGVTASAPAVDPHESFGPPPAEMLQPSGDATVLFDAKMQFDGGETPTGAEAPGSDGAGNGALAAEAPAAGGAAVGAAPALDALDGDPGAEPAPIDDDETTDASAVEAVSPADDLAEDIDTAEGNRPPGTPPPPPRLGPLGDPEAASHQDAVGRFASEIPSHPRGVQPPDGALLDQATRITHAEEVLKPAAPKVVPITPSPPKVSVSPSAAALPEVAPSKIRSAARDTKVPPDRRKLYIAGGVGGVLAVAAAVAVAAAMRGGSPATGTLAILTEPDHDVSILVDDKVVDHASPVFVRHLSPGFHKVELRAGTGPGKASRMVKVTAGAEAHVSLRIATPKPAPPPAPPPTPAVATPPAPTPKPVPSPTPHAVATTQPTPPKPHPAPPAVPTTGTAILESSPSGALVKAGHHVLGHTPYTARHLDLDGVHRFTLSKAGYHAKDVLVAFAGKPIETVHTSLEALPPPPPRRRRRRRIRRHPAAPQGHGSLIAQCIPWAKVLVDGHDTGRVTPITGVSPLKLPAGKHKVTFIVQGGKQKSFTVKIAADKQSRLIYRFAH